MSLCRSLDEEQTAQAIVAYQAGATCKALGQQFGRSEKAIAELMKRHGVSGGRYTRSRHADPEFLAMRKAGRTALEISVHFGVKDRAVEVWIRQAIKAGLVEKIGNSTRRWSDADAERLKQLWETMGPAEISRATGWGVDQVIGKARRMALPRKTYPTSRAPATGRTYDHLREARKKQAQEAAERRAAAIQIRTEQAEVMWAATADSRPFNDRKANECAWPLEDGPRRHACCRPTEGRDSYCAHHRLVAGGGPTTFRASSSYPPLARGPRSLFDRSVMR